MRRLQGSARSRAKLNAILAVNISRTNRTDFAPIDRLLDNRFLLRCGSKRHERLSAHKRKC